MPNFAVRKATIIFIGTSVYLKFFQRFYASFETFFLPGISKEYVVFTENVLQYLPSNVTVVKIGFADPRTVKMRKFSYISQSLLHFEGSDAVFYFDADTVLKATISSELVNSWFATGVNYIGVLHPWDNIRSRNKRFESNVISEAYVPLEERGIIDYHQSCFWASRVDSLHVLVESVCSMIKNDMDRRHVNSDGICDEIYVNRFFVSHHSQLLSLGTEYAHPGPEYARVTARDGRAGYTFPAEQIIVHDNANQTRSWESVDDQWSAFTHGAYAQFYKCDLAAYHALEMYRSHNPNNPVVVVSDGGDDLSSLARHFNCEYIHYDANIGTSRNHRADTNQHDRLKRIENACSFFTAVDWIVILEPDVETFRAPSRIPRYALCGPSRGPGWTEGLASFIQKAQPTSVRKFGLGHNYTGCGGSIFNQRAFLDCFQSVDPEVFSVASDLDSRVRTAEDANLSFLFQFNGFDTGGWEDFTGWKDPERESFAFVHGNKEWYGKKAPHEVAACA